MRVLELQLRAAGRGGRAGVRRVAAGLLVEPDLPAFAPDHGDGPRTRKPAEGFVVRQGRQRFSPLDSHWELVGAGGIHTTPNELVRWADNYRTGTVGGDDLLTAQTADPVQARGAYRYGAGILVNQDGTLWHDGTWEGFITAFRVSPDRHTAVAVSCNINEGNAEPIATTLMSLWT
jgi:Beta-lactamase